MTGIPPERGGELDNYIRQQLQKKLHELGAQVDNDYFENAVQVYSRPGSILRQQFYKTKADAAQAEVKAQQYGGGLGDYAGRAARDFGGAAISAVSSPIRAAMWGADKLGVPGMRSSLDEYNQFQQNLHEKAHPFADATDPNADEPLGNRGLAENPALAALQTTAPEVLGSIVGAGPAANYLTQKSGNLLYNLAGKYPGSSVLARLGTVPAENIAANATMGSRLANVGRAAPRSIATGMAGGMGSMPSESFNKEGLTMGAVLSALGAASAGTVGGRVRTPATTPSMMSRARAMFQPPEMGASAEPGLQPNDTGGIEVPVIDPIAPPPAAPVAPTPQVASTVSQRRPITATRAEATPAAGKERGGGAAVDWAKLDSSVLEDAQALWANTTDPAARAKLLGVEDAIAKGDQSIADHIAAAQSPQDLQGYLGKRLLAGMGVKKVPRVATPIEDIPVPGAAAAQTPATASPVVSEPPATVPAAAPVDPIEVQLGDLKKKVAAQEWWRNLSVADRGAAVGNAPAPAKDKLGVPLGITSMGQVRDFTILPHDLQAKVIAAFDATQAPVASAKPVVAVRKKGAAGATPIEQIKVPGQAPVVPPVAPAPAAPVAAAVVKPAVARSKGAAGATPIEDIKVPPKPAAAPVTPGTPPTVGTVSKRGAKLPIVAEEPGATATPSQGEPGPVVVDAPGWDRMGAATRAAHMQRIAGVTDARAQVMSLMPFEQLPAKLRTALQTDTQLGDAIKAARAAAEGATAPGGAPPEGAGFPAAGPVPDPGSGFTALPPGVDKLAAALSGKPVKRIKAKPKPAADIPETDATGKRKLPRKPKSS